MSVAVQIGVCLLFFRSWNLVTSSLSVLENTLRNNSLNLHLFTICACVQMHGSTLCAHVSVTAHTLCVSAACWHVRLCIREFLCKTVQHVLSLRNTLRGFAKLSSYSWDTDIRCALYSFVQDTFQAGQLNSEQHSSWSLQLTGRTARIKATAGRLIYGCSSDLEIPEKIFLFIMP